jgi:hypothetical protein
MRAGSQNTCVFVWKNTCVLHFPYKKTQCFTPRMITRSVSKSMHRKRCGLWHEEKIMGKFTVLSSREWWVELDHNTDLRRLKNWFLVKWKSNRPATSLKCRTASFKGEKAKINPQEIVIPSAVARSNQVDKRQQV